MMDWDAAAAHALTLPDCEVALFYGKPAVRVARNGRAFLSPGNEPATSFCVQIDIDTVAMLIETNPDSFFQTPHYSGYGAVLVRYDSPDIYRVKTMIERARDQAASRPAARPRKKK